MLFYAISHPPFLHHYLLILCRVVGECYEVKELHHVVVVYGLPVVVGYLGYPFDLCCPSPSFVELRFEFFRPREFIVLLILLSVRLEEIRIALSQSSRSRKKKADMFTTVMTSR